MALNGPILTHEKVADIIEWAQSLSSGKVSMTLNVLRSDFIHTQIHWTASFIFSLPHTEAHVRYDLSVPSCTI